MLTVPGRFLLFAAGLIGLAAILWPSNSAHQKENDSASVCPLGFTSSGGDKAKWSAANHPLHVAVGDRALARAGREMAARSPDTRYHLFFNATIWTGEEISEHRQEGGFADALLVRDGGIVAVGSLQDVRRVLSSGLPRALSQGRGQGQGHERGLPDAPMLSSSSGSNNSQVRTKEQQAAAEVVVEYDMSGSFLMPGFVDAHVHVIPAGLSLSRVDLRGVTSRAAFQERVMRQAARLGPADWLLGGQWDEGDWGGEMPRSDWLDQVCGGRPAYLTRHDLHMALANTAALELAGIGPHTAGPEGGIIDRDPATGRPTGLLRERAMSLMEAIIPPPSAAERRSALEAASRHALSRGVTSLVDMGRYLAGEDSGPWLDMQEVYMPAADSGDLSVRVFVMVPLRSWRRLASWVAAYGPAHPGGRLFWGGLKEFADGSLGSRTALMWEPYSDVGDVGGEEGHTGPDPCGQRGLGLEELRELTTAAVRSGLQVAVHAIGDRAVDDVARTFGEALLAATGGPQAAVVEAGLTSGTEASVSSTPGRVPIQGEATQEGRMAADMVKGKLDEQRRRLGQSLRLRIEHVQHLSGATNATAALVHNGLTPVPNPLHLLTDAAMLEPRLGPGRAARAFALRSLRHGGLRPALASDWPVVDLQPLTGVYAAVHRHVPPPAVAKAMRAKLLRCERFQLVGEAHLEDDDGDGSNSNNNVDVERRSEVKCSSDGLDVTAPKISSCSGGSGHGESKESQGGGWPTSVTPEERLSLEEALLGHTAWGAAAAGLEDYVGRLAPGLRADFVELSDSLAEQVEGREKGKDSSVGVMRLSEERLRRCLPVVTRTWLDGQLVYDRKAV